MTYDLKEFSENQESPKPIDNDTGNLSISSNTLFGTAWEAIKAAIRFKATKLLLFFAFTVAVMLITGDFTKSKNIASDMSDKGANEDYIGLFGVFAKETGHKSTKLNMHPFYHTRGTRALEAKYKVDFGREIKLSKVFAYAVYEDQDFMVMKGVARGKDNERLNLDNWTFFGMSSDDYCEDYFDGFVPDDEMESYFVSGSKWRIKKIKNKEGQKRFRCVIGPDVIEDYIEDDRED
jgi:hypothetical protein